MAFPAGPSFERVDGAPHGRRAAESLASEAFVAATVSVVATHAPKNVSFVSNPCSSSALSVCHVLTDSPPGAQGAVNSANTASEAGAEGPHSGPHKPHPTVGFATGRAKVTLTALEVRAESVPSAYWLGEGQGTGTPRPHDPDDNDSYKPNQATTEARLAVQRSQSSRETVPRLERQSSGESYQEDDTPPSSRRASPLRSKSAANLGRFLGKLLSMKKREAAPPLSPVAGLRAQSSPGEQRD